MSNVGPKLREQVIHRAGNRCEYCGLSQVSQEAVFHADHVVPVASGGPTSLENLALACVSCSLRKGAKTFAADPQTGEEAALFNPRTQVWSDHFRWQGEMLIGDSPTGRATVIALSMNRPLILPIRREESLRGRHPPE
jgi:hypothetical protein